MKLHTGGRPQRSVEELVLRVKELLEELAASAGASGFIWLVVKKEGGNLGGCSPNLKPYKAALADEVEKATERPVVVALEGDPPRLPRTESVLLALAKTRHVELHPIVAMMIQGVNEINNHKVPRVKALADPKTIPAWFPLSAEAYASRSQKMDLHQLFSVLDSIFGEVRGNLRSIRALHQMLDKAYKTGSCSIGTRAGMDSFFYFLEEEALLSARALPGGDAGNAIDGSLGPGYDNILSAFGKYHPLGDVPMRGGGDVDCFLLPPVYPIQPAAYYANNGISPETYLDQKNPLMAKGLQSSALLQALERNGGTANGGVSHGTDSVCSKEGAPLTGQGIPLAPSTERAPEEEASEAVEKCAMQKGGKDFLWVVVTEKDGTLGGCSSQLQPYGPALMDQVERAAREPIAFPIGPSKSLPKVADVFRPLTSVRHMDLQPIVAVLINGMDDVTSQKASRKRARKDLSQVPAWYPLPAEKYGGRLQSLDLDECFLIIDAILGHVRGQPSAIAKLRGSLDHFFADNPGCPVGTRAGIEGFLDYLEAEAEVPRGSTVEDGGARKFLHRRSAFTPCRKEEAGGAGFDGSASVKIEAADSEAKVGSVQENGAVNGEERRRTSEQSGQAEVGEEVSVHCPTSTAAVRTEGKAEAGMDRCAGSQEGSDSGKENLDQGGSGAVNGGPESKPTEALPRSRKRSRRGPEGGLAGTREGPGTTRGGSQARSDSPVDQNGENKPVYKPVPQKPPQAYGRMLSLFEALDTSSGGPVVG